MTGDYYLWAVPAKPVGVQLSLAVIDRLHGLILQSQKHGEEGLAFGMLLGETRKVRGGGRRTTAIHDFEPLNVARLRSRPPAPEGCGLRVVGLYHSRPGSEMRLDHVDAALIRNAFTESGMVYLLIQPRPGQASEAAFFIQEDGDIHGYRSYLNFPFHPDTLRSQGEVARWNGKPRRLGWAPVAAVAGLTLIGGAAYMWPRGREAAAAALPAPVVQQPSTPSPVGSPVAAPPEKKPAVRSKPVRRNKIRAKTPKRQKAVSGSPRRPGSRFRKMVSKIRGLRPSSR